MLLALECCGKPAVLCMGWIGYISDNDRVLVIEALPGLAVAAGAGHSGMSGMDQSADGLRCTSGINDAWREALRGVTHAVHAVHTTSRCARHSTLGMPRHGGTPWRGTPRPGTAQPRKRHATPRHAARAPICCAHHDTPRHATTHRGTTCMTRHGAHDGMAADEGEREFVFEHGQRPQAACWSTDGAPYCATQRLR